MNYLLIKENILLIEKFEAENKTSRNYNDNIEGFKLWIADSIEEHSLNEPDWEGKENGRSAESAINTLIIHLNRYAKIYSKSAIHNSEFSTQEEFIYLINLKAFGEMTKMELIKKNIHEKPVGIQIVNRLIKHGWVKQKDSEIDKRSKLIQITQKGLDILENQMDKIRQATKIVTGDLSHVEKMLLIRLLKKLEDFHHPIFSQNIDNSELLHQVKNEFFPETNLN